MVQLSTVFQSCFLASEDLSYVDRRARSVCQGHHLQLHICPAGLVSQLQPDSDLVLDAAHLGDSMKMIYQRDKPQLFSSRVLGKPLDRA